MPRAAADGEADTVIIAARLLLFRPLWYSAATAGGRRDAVEVRLLGVLAEVGAFDLDLLAHLVQTRAHAFADAIAQGLAARGALRSDGLRRLLISALVSCPSGKLVVMMVVRLSL